jgi:hypothetical protein
LLQVINSGLGRTGTTSLKVALERLGFGPCFHMFDIVNSDERLGQWEKIVCDGQQPDWAAAFDGYTSAADGPCAIYYRELMAAFPEAKLILTVRDGERWYQSTHDTLYRFARMTQESQPPVNSFPARMYRLTSAMVWQGLFAGRFSDKDYAIEVFRAHNQAVIDSVDPGRLLVYDVAQGWAPLCAFLGVPVPAEEFPRANDTAAMQAVLARVGGGR